MPIPSIPPSSPVKWGTGVLAALKNALNAVGGLVGYSGNIGAATGTSLTLGAGTAASPALLLGTSPSPGLYASTTTILDIAIGGADTHRFSGNGYFITPSAGQIVTSSGGVIGISSGTAGATSSDVALSRLSAGVFGVGTGAQGSVAGKISASTHRCPTAATFPASPATGDIAAVSTATAPAIGSAIALGGAVFALGVYNGAQWTCIGK